MCPVSSQFLCQLLTRVHRSVRGNNIWGNIIRFLVQSKISSIPFVTPQMAFRFAHIGPDLSQICIDFEITSIVVFICISTRPRIASRPSAKDRTCTCICAKIRVGSLLNKALTTELSQHCAYCHSAISVRAIRKHYSDAHPQLLGYEPHCHDQIRGLINLGPLSMHAYQDEYIGFLRAWSFISWPWHESAAYSGSL